VTLALAGSRTQDQFVSLRTIGLEGPRRGIRPGRFLGFGSVVLRERRGRVSILRSAVIELDRKSVSLGDESEEPRTATMILPKPFGGEGSYAKETGGTSIWSGSLGAWLPGAGTVPLTGPDFVAAVCRSKTKGVLRRCVAPAEKELGVPPGAALLSLPQGSGSQSQDCCELRLSSSR
jgi:hypothetical protein